MTIETLNARIRRTTIIIGIKLVSIVQALMSFLMPILFFVFIKGSKNTAPLINIAIDIGY